MKIRSLFLLLCAAFFICFIKTSFASLVDEKGNPSPGLLEVFRELSPLLKTSKALPPEKIQKILNPATPSSEVSLENLNRLAQDKLMRPVDVERAELKGSAFDQQFSSYPQRKLWSLFENLGFIDAIYPSQKPFQYILINGATIPAMRKRVQTCIDFCKTGKIKITPDVQIIFLTGDRDLSADEKAGASQVQLKTEYDAAKWIWSQTELPLALRGVKITFVNAPKQVEKDELGKETLRRPDTLGTIRTWIESNPKPGHCLSISSQPYVFYQEAIIRGAFKTTGLDKKGFTVEGVGDKASDATLLSVLIDNLARTIYAVFNSLKKA